VTFAKGMYGYGGEAGAPFEIEEILTDPDGGHLPPERHWGTVLWMVEVSRLVSVADLEHMDALYESQWQEGLDEAFRAAGEASRAATGASAARLADVQQNHRPDPYAKAWRTAMDLGGWGEGPVNSALLGVICRDLATDEGPFTHDHVRALCWAWEQVRGPIVYLEEIS
jgi:hypothetical protein